LIVKINLEAFAVEHFSEPEIVRASRALYHAIDRLDHFAAQKMGISRNELRCLNLLENGPVRPGQITLSLNFTSGSVTTMLDRLEKKGLIQRKLDPTDRRGSLISATAKVFAELGPIYKSVAISLGQTVARYSIEERQRAVAHLNDVTHACLNAIEMH
jgi:DNA-binding MarR family transcriptional regulator